MKNLLNDKEYTERKFLQNLISSAFGSQLCSSRGFRAKCMLDTDQQGVASEIMSFSRVFTNARARRLLKKLFPWISTARTRISLRNQGTLG